jgi:hypothetical protein
MFDDGIFGSMVLRCYLAQCFKKLQQHKHNGCLFMGVIWPHFYKIVATQAKAHLVVEVLLGPVL